MRASWVVVTMFSLVVSAAFIAEAQNNPNNPNAPGRTSPPPKGQQSPSASANKSYEATKHIAVINAGLQDAAVNADMLANISSDKRSYDRSHAEIFLGNIRDAVNQSETHLAHLQPMASSTNEKNQFQELSKALKSAKAMMQPISNQLDKPEAVHDAATKLNKQFKDGMSPLKQLAQSLDAKVRIG